MASRSGMFDTYPFCRSVPEPIASAAVHQHCALDLLFSKLPKNCCSPNSVVLLSERMSFRFQQSAAIGRTYPVDLLLALRNPWLLDVQIAFVIYSKLLACNL